MKKAISLLLSLVMMISIISGMELSSFAAADIAINETNFPDANFRAYVQEECDTDGNGVLSNAEISSATNIGVRGSGITSLKGIEYFTALTYLWCSSNQLESLDVSKNTALTELDCSYNDIKNLDVSGATSLTTLWCESNQLTSLDVSKNTALKYLECGNNLYSNQLTSLDVSKNTALTSLKCGNNQLTSLDVSNNTALTELSCGSNQLTSLDVSKNTALTELDCGYNDIKNLDVSGATSLTKLLCVGNQLTSLDVSNNTALTELDCHYNDIKNLDVSKNTELTKLDCFNNNNQLTSLDVSKNTKLTSLDCGYNYKLKSLDVSKNTELTELLCGGNQLTSLDVSKNTALTSLSCSENQLTSLDLSNNTALTYLKCNNNRFNIVIDKSGNYDLSTLPGSFDVSKASDWKGASVNGNMLTANKGAKEVTYTYDMGNGKTETFTLIITLAEINETNFPDANFRAYVQENFDTDYNDALSIDEIENATEIDVFDLDVTSLKGIEYFTALTDLDCHYSQLTSLDVSKNTALTRLDCSYSQLTSLDVSKNTALVYLFCDGNQLTSLDVSKNTALTRLFCSDNQLTSLDVSNNTSLSYLDCWGNQLTNLDVSNNTALEDLYCSGNQFAIEIDENGKFDLSTLPGNFDVSNASDWNGASVNGNILTVNGGIDEVTYTYDMGNGKTETFTINVNNPSVIISSIEVSTMPTKTVYTVGETFSSDGLTIKVNMSDGTSETLTEGFTVSSPDMTTAGTKTVTVTYDGKTTTFDITVNNPTPEVTLGDVNGDNEIKIIDAKWILQSIAGTKALTDAQKAAADLNKDGKITIVDAKWVLQIVAGTRDATTL